MGRLKTHKGTAKRFKVTGRGKLVHGRVGRRHLQSSKPAKRTRHLRRPAAVAPENKAKIRSLIPYA
jgi:large subunit ribosomal protein L35